MTRDDAIARLRSHADALRALGATAVYLFGSTARDEADAESDVDLFVDHDRAPSFSLLDLVGIKQYLDRALPARVDVTTRRGLHPSLRADIERGAIRVF
jgi:hypothetical protein